MVSLTSYPSLVEVPFIKLEIAGYTFGVYEESGHGNQLELTYPNFVKDIEITKINGQLNTYKISMEYQVTPGDDPNFLDAIFSANKAKYGWQKIIISYGDLATPSFIFKEEEAIITKITSNFGIGDASISYNLECISTKLAAITNAYSFPATTGKPSELLINLLSNKAYGLQDLFPSMSSKEQILKMGTIATDDREVKIEAQENISVLDYMNYLCDCMQSASESPNTIIKSSKYVLSICDNTDPGNTGAYVKVTRVNSNDTSQDGPDTFLVDIGYPGNNFVSEFSIDQDNYWAIFYDYSLKLNQPKYVKSIDNNGNLVSTYSPAVTTNKKYKYTTESDKTWWTNMTEFPIKANLTIKGLLKPAILMSKVRINVYFYGIKHISSGLYIITQQEDTLSANGYKTKLSLTRIAPDNISKSTNPALVKDQIIH